jgi:hypothetical protein
MATRWSCVTMRTLGRGCGIPRFPTDPGWGMIGIAIYDGPRPAIWGRDDVPWSRDRLYILEQVLASIFH